MAKVNWTFQALEDVSDIADFHAQNSERYSSFLVSRFFERTELLEPFPHSGRIVPEANLPSIRELLVNNYRIIYAVPNADEVNILAVRHSARPLSEFSLKHE